METTNSDKLKFYLMLGLFIIILLPLIWVYLQTNKPEAISKYEELPKNDATLDTATLKNLNKRLNTFPENQN
jgi:hypothetical protein